MCCFSGSVAEVSGTRIFARRGEDRAQHLAYEMSVAAATDVAMVLPLPTDPTAGEDAVSFVDLSGVATLFSSLEALFPVEGAARSRSLGIPRGGAALAVHAVGDFEASFVPRAEDFARLDPSFRLSAAVIDALCAREPMGFAVFQLRGLGDPPPVAPSPAPWWRRLFARDASTRPARPRARRIHPMGLTFRSRLPDQLFYPTVHVHDGTLPDLARFDHVLFAQGIAASEWQHSRSAPPDAVVTSARGILAPGLPLQRRALGGLLPNRDILVPG